MAEKGSRSGESRCFMWFIGPINTENLNTRISIIENFQFIIDNVPKHNQKTPKAAVRKSHEIWITPEGKKPA